MDDERVPFEVLLDEDGSAAEIAGTNKIGIAALTPSAISAGVGAVLGGHRQAKTGRRPMQLGATLVMAPGDIILYSDFEDFAGDHADVEEVLAVLK